MNLKLKHILVIITIIFCADSFAGGPPPPPPDPPGGGGGPGCWPPPCNPIPIDGGLTYLIIAGAAIGGRKIYKMNIGNKG